MKLIIPFLILLCSQTLLAQNDSKIRFGGRVAYQYYGLPISGELAMPSDLTDSSYGRGVTVGFLGQIPINNLFHFHLGFGYSQMRFLELGKGTRLTGPLFYNYFSFVRTPFLAKAEIFSTVYVGVGGDLVFPFPKEEYETFRDDIELEFLFTITKRFWDLIELNFRYSRGLSKVGRGTHRNFRTGEEERYTYSSHSYQFGIGYLF